MLFNSLAFVIFYPIVTLLYFLLPHKFRWAHLLIASCVFYLFFIPVYIFILIFTIIIDYVAGIMIEHNYGKTRKLYLIISIIANVGVLAVFKYYNFFIENINAFLELLHITTQPIPFWKIILPIGLSFHTFQAMSYTIEVYRGNQKAEKHFGIYALYVMFYPQLVAGPIERPQNMLFQFKEKHFFNSQNLLDGFRLMLWGFFKKVVIADRLALYVNPVFDHPYKYHYLNLIIASIFFAIQIYCDFSGYSDIAIGTAKTIGFDLMTNFNRPYFSNNIQDFWKRWHISLSTWFRDYVYIPLGGNRVSVPRAYLNIAIVFILSGLWHGANWTFIVWGTLHAFFMIVTVFLKKQFGESSSFFAKTMNLLITFFIVTFAWVFFRANNITDAFLILKHIVGLYKAQPFQFILLNYAGGIEFTASGIAISIITILLLFAVEMKLPSNMTTLNSKPVADIFFCSVVLFFILFFGVFQSNSFIYFQF
jgi:alginate O-acetyltransferase complex protein AlgI